MEFRLLWSLKWLGTARTEKPILVTSPRAE